MSPEPASRDGLYRSSHVLPVFTTSVVKIGGLATTIAGRRRHDLLRVGSLPSDLPGQLVNLTSRSGLPSPTMTFFRVARHGASLPERRSGRLPMSRRVRASRDRAAAALRVLGAALHAGRRFGSADEVTSGHCPSPPGYRRRVRASVRRSFPSMPPPVFAASCRPCSPGDAALGIGPWSRALTHSKSVKWQTVNRRSPQGGTGPAWSARGLCVVRAGLPMRGRLFAHSIVPA